jgi:hypothetical protein
MKKFYARLEKAEMKDDARFSQLAKVREADLSVIQKSEALTPWAWWTEE